MSSRQQINSIQRSGLTAKRSYRRFIAGLIAMLMAVTGYAVETIIVGEVVNEMTGEAIPNVNIHFRGTKIGTTSDEHGNYALRVDMSAQSQLVFSAVGYFTQRFNVEPGSMAGLQVAMREKVATLTECRGAQRKPCTRDSSTSAGTSTGQRPHTASREHFLRST